MNKQELIKVMSENADISKTDAAKALDAFEYAIAATLHEGGEVNITDFGKFKANPQPARMMRNPQNGEPVAVPAKKRVSFIAGKGLKDTINLD